VLVERRRHDGSANSAEVSKRSSFFVRTLLTKHSQTGGKRFLPIHTNVTRMLVMGASLKCIWNCFATQDEKKIRMKRKMNKWNLDVDKVSAWAIFGFPSLLFGQSRGRHTSCNVSNPVQALSSSRAHHRPVSSHWHSRFSQSFRSQGNSLQRHLVAGNSAARSDCPCRGFLDNFFGGRCVSVSFPACAFHWFLRRNCF